MKNKQRSKPLFCASIAIVMLTVLPSCKPVITEGQTQKRLEALEHSVDMMRQEQIKTRHTLRLLAIRQDLLKKGVRRGESRLKNDRALIKRLGNNSDEDAARLDELSTVLGRMIDPLHKMRMELSRLKTRFFHLYQQQRPIAQQTQGNVISTKDLAAKPTTSPGVPVDRKKRKKVLESVA